jgi:hypothetical protein
MQKTVVCEMRWFAKCDDLRARNCSWCFQSVCCGLIDVRTLKAAVLHKVSERTKQDKAEMRLVDCLDQGEGEVAQDIFLCCRVC